VKIPVTLESGNILVAGGNGFIGTHVVEKLKKMNFNVTVLDRLNYPPNKNINFVLGDIRNEGLIRDLLSENDGVINLAGILGTSETIDNPRGTISSNVVGALNIFNSAKEFKIPAVQITVGNYWMNNPYAITKHASEKIALHYNEKYKTKFTVIRGLNAYGGGQKDYPVRKLMPNLIIPALKNSDILIYGDGKQIMDMIYVKDLAEILIRGLILDHKCWNKVIEGGSGDKTTVNEICDLVLKITKSTAKVHYIPMRGGEPKHAVVLGNPDTMKPLGMSKKDLLSLNDGIKKSINYYKSIIDY
tara:strand:+ start:1900 stop:2805 length:906 start_codon:yes stop_codon:yes gene_type:complete